MKGFLHLSKRRKQKGFTLIEIMVVVVIIAMLGAIVLPNVMGRLDVARENRIKTDIRSIETALKSYRLDNYRYPTQAQGLKALMIKPDDARRWRGPYIERAALDPWGIEYKYLNPGTHGKKIEIFTLGDDEVEGGEGDGKDWGSWNIDE